MEESPRMVHLYAQPFWHGDAHIVANRAGLERLKEAIDALLKDAGTNAIGAFAGDGEGYNVFVTRVDDEKTWDRLAVGYSDETASEKRNAEDGVVWPFDLIGQDRYKELSEKAWAKPEEK